jgi:hypothetical protein
MALRFQPTLWWSETARAGLIVNDCHADILALRERPHKGAFEGRLDYPNPIFRVS